MRKIINLGLIILLTLASGIHADNSTGGTPKPEMHEFKALVSNVRLNSILIERGLKNSDQTSVTVSAVMFDEPLVVSDLWQSKPHTFKEINTIVGYTKANIAGSPEDLLAFWVDSERNEKAKSIKDPELFKKNREIHNTYVTDLTIVGVVFQEKTTAVLVERFGRVMAMSLIKKGDKYYITDNPSNDLELAIIEASFIN